MRRGEVWWASLPTPAGSGPGSRRPVIVLQCDPFNQSRISTVVVAAATSNVRLADAPGNVLLAKRVSGLPRDSTINVCQILNADKSFLTEGSARCRENFSQALSLAWGSCWDCSRHRSRTRLSAVVDALGGVSLLPRKAEIVLEDTIYDTSVRADLGSSRWPAPAVAGRHRVRKHLTHGVSVQTDHPGCLPDAHAVDHAGLDQRCILELIHLKPSQFQTIQASLLLTVVHSLEGNLVSVELHEQLCHPNQLCRQLMRNRRGVS